MFLLDLQMTANTAASFLFLLANGNMQTESKKKAPKHTVSLWGLREECQCGWMSKYIWLCNEYWATYTLTDRIL